MLGPVVGAAVVTVVACLQIALACAVSAVIGAHLTGEFVIADSTYTTSCALSMQSNSICVAGYATTALTICAQLVVIGTQCAAADGQLTKYGFTGPLLSILGFIWWVGYSAAATQAANQASHWTLEASLDPYRTAVVALSWCTTALFIPAFLASAMTVSAAARACTRLSSIAASEGVRFTQPASPPVSPCKSSSRTFNSCYEPFKESESPKKWTQPANPHSTRFAVTSDGHRTLLVVGGQPVPLSPSPSLTQSPSVSPKARSPTYRGLQSSASFTNVLLPP